MRLRTRNIIKQVLQARDLIERSDYGEFRCRICGQAGLKVRTGHMNTFNSQTSPIMHFRVVHPEVYDSVKNSVMAEESVDIVEKMRNGDILSNHEKQELGMPLKGVR